MTFAMALLLAAALNGDAGQVRYWNLPTGSRLAYVHVPAQGAAKRTALLFLHGGPGAYQVSEFKRGRAWYASLAQRGFDVYVYDQTGSGLSARLNDPRAYTVARHVADLEAIRQTIGAARMILIGDSWGATLAANYIAAHPDRV